MIAPARTLGDYDSEQIEIPTSVFKYSAVAVIVLALAGGFVAYKVLSYAEKKQRR